MDMKKKVPLLLFCSSLLISTNTFSQDISADKSKPSEAIENIVVSGDSIGFYRHVMNKAEDDLFDLYNDLALKNDFKVKCERKNRHGFTRIKHRKCESNFVSRIQYEALQREISTGSKRQLANGKLTSNSWLSRSSLTNGYLYAEMRKLKEDQIEDFEQKLLAHPELQQKLIKFLEAREKFEQARSSS